VVALLGCESQSDFSHVWESGFGEEVKNRGEVIVAEREVGSGVKHLESDKASVVVDEEERHREDAAGAGRGERGVDIVAAADGG